MNNDELQQLLIKLGLNRQQTQEDADILNKNNLPAMAKSIDTGTSVPYSNEVVDAEQLKALQGNNFGSNSIPELNYQKLYQKLKQIK